MIVFKELLVGDVEDPEIYAAGPILDWEKSEEGQWVMENALEQPSYRIIHSYDTMGYKVQIYGKLSPVNETFFTLKYR